MDPYSRLRREVLVVVLEDAPRASILVALGDVLVALALVLNALVVLIALIAFYVAFLAFLVALSSLYFYFIVYI